MIAAAVLAAAAAATPYVVGDSLDCALGFDTLDAQIRALPYVKPYGVAPDLATYSDSSTITLYAITRPGHPAHPVVVKRKINGPTVATSACGYGDKAGFDDLMQQIQILNADVRKNYGG